MRPTSPGDPHQAHPGSSSAPPTRMFMSRSDAFDSSSVSPAFLPGPRGLGAFATRSVAATRSDGGWLDLSTIPSSSRVGPTVPGAHERGWYTAQQHVHHGHTAMRTNLQYVAGRGYHPHGYEGHEHWRRETRQVHHERDHGNNHCSGGDFGFSARSNTDYRMHGNHHGMESYQDSTMNSWPDADTTMRTMKPDELSDRSTRSFNGDGEDVDDISVGDGASPEQEDADEDNEEIDEEVEPAQSPKKSRYLREMDRRVILQRLADGERQAALAKEFGVSRAAICNLYKHRHEVLARTHENPYAKHPKKKARKDKAPRRRRRHSHDSAMSSSSRGSSSPSVSSLSASTTNMSISKSSSASNRESRMSAAPLPAALHEVRSRPVQALLCAISDRALPLPDFRRSCERALWLLVEEALALVPIKSTQVAVSDTDVVSGCEVEQPPCAISMEPQGITPMLHVFQRMEPSRPSGAARVTSLPARTIEMDDDCLPPSLYDHHIFVLDVVAASGEAVCSVLQHLQRHYDAQQASISVVSLFTSSEVVAMVQCQYPRVKLVTARIDSTITRKRNATTTVDWILHRLRLAYTGSTSPSD